MQSPSENQAKTYQGQIAQATSFTGDLDEQGRKIGYGRLNLSDGSFCVGHFEKDYLNGDGMM